MRLFPRNTAGGSEITPADDALNRVLLAQTKAERLLDSRYETVQLDYPPVGYLASIDRERKRIAAMLKTENYARNHP